MAQLCKLTKQKSFLKFEDLTGFVLHEENPFSTFETFFSLEISNPLKRLNVFDSI
jgi:hypothetical protein